MRLVKERPELLLFRQTNYAAGLVLFGVGSLCAGLSLLVLMSSGASPGLWLLLLVAVLGTAGGVYSIFSGSELELDRAGGRLLFRTRSLFGGAKRGCRFSDVKELLFTTELKYLGGGRNSSYRIWCAKIVLGEGEPILLDIGTKKGPVLAAAEKAGGVIGCGVKDMSSGSV